MIARMIGARGSAGMLLVAAACVLWTGCGGSDGTPNRPPAVEIVTNHVEGDTTFYQLPVFWTGSDPDGRVVRFEYAVDPPPVFTEAEIADPVHSRGIGTTVIPGPGENRDTLRVLKVAGGAAHTFDWIGTPELSHTFTFSATEPDSAETEGERVPTGRFHGMHALYVRAVDDRGGTSVPDRVAFTAETLAPESWITHPDLNADFLNIGGRITVSWNGTDPDCASGTDGPTGYLYRLLDLRSLDPPAPIYVAQPELLFDEAGTESLWTRVDGDSLSATFFPDVPGSYMVGVRAVDEAGAVEPFLNFHRNCFKFQTLASAGFPLLTVEEPTLGTFGYKGYVSTPYFRESLAGIPLRFEVSCDASPYGGTCGDMRWGVDLADPEAEEGWSDWRPTGSIPEFELAAGQHVFHIQVRDDVGTTTTGRINILASVAAFDRDVLWVDDSRDGSYPTDAEHDAFWEQLFDDSGRFAAGAVDKHEMHGANDTYSRSPIPPAAAELGRYRLLVWENYGAGYNGDSGLWEMTTKSRILRSYLLAGGQIWIDGRLTMPAMLPAPGLGADLHYPVAVSPGTFPWDFLKLRTYRVLNARGGVTAGTSADDNLVGVLPFPGRPEVYPAMEMDPAKLSPFANGISNGDVVIGPVLNQGPAAFPGVLDSLYVYQSVDQTEPFDAGLHNALNAVRWHDPDPAREQGRVQWFGFPLYSMKKEQAQETFNRSIDWFREEGLPTP